LDESEPLPKTIFKTTLEIIQNSCIMIVCIKYHINSD